MKTECPKTLEQLRHEQNRLKNRFAFKPTVLPKAYADKLNRQPQSGDIMARVAALVLRPQKRLSQAMDYEDARKYVFEIGKLKLAERGRVWEVDEYNRGVITETIKYFICDPSCEHDLNKGLFFFGGVGRGKTFLMEVMQVFCEAARIGQRQYLNVSTIDVVQKAKDYSEASRKDGNNPLSYYSDPGKVFCFDDLGAEPGTVKVYGNETAAMETILTKRYQRFINGFCLTHVTSNCTPDDLEKRYGTRLADRFNEMFNFILIGGESRRK
ncbi:MAG: hypothetical protein AAFZ15_34340 [Bacteroidota bacterium]